MADRVRPLRAAIACGVALPGVTLRMLDGGEDAGPGVLGRFGGDCETAIVGGLGCHGADCSDTGCKVRLRDPGHFEQF